MYSGQGHDVLEDSAAAPSTRCAAGRAPTWSTPTAATESSPVMATTGSWWRKLWPRRRPSHLKTSRTYADLVGLEHVRIVSAGW